MVGQRADGVTYSETADYWEAPIDARTSLVFTPWIESANDIDRGQRGEAVVGIKRLIFRDGGTALAMQAGAFWKSEPGEGCSEGGVELRFLGGTSSASGDRFINVELAGQALEGGCGGEKLDVTFGYHPTPHWMGLAQIFADSPQDGDESVKTQLTLVHFGDKPGHGVQIGVRARLDGGDAEPAVVMAFWG